MRCLGNSFDNLLGLFADGTSSDHLSLSGIKVKVEGTCNTALVLSLS